VTSAVKLSLDRTKEPTVNSIDSQSQIARDQLCVCGHQASRHAPIKSGDTRCLAVEHPADLINVFDDGREHAEMAYCACLRFTATRSPRTAS
jgi:hypothetical protein